MDKLSETWTVFPKDKENNNIALLAFEISKISRGTYGIKQIIRIKNRSKKQKA